MSTLSVYDYREGYFWQVYNFLKEKNLVPFDTMLNSELSTPTRDGNSIEIALPEKVLRTKLLFGIFPSTNYLYVIVGWIVFNRLGAGSDSKNWELEVYGRNYFGPMKSLAIEMQKKYKVKIHVSLVSEHEKIQLTRSEMSED